MSYRRRLASLEGRRVAGDGLPVVVHCHAVTSEDERSQAIERQMQKQGYVSGDDVLAVVIKQFGWQSCPA